jgi:hypothetical protein
MGGAGGEARVSNGVNMKPSVRPIVQRTTGSILHQAGCVTRGVARESLGALKRVRDGGGRPKPGMDDITLARKVETVIFRGTRGLKGKVDVNAVDGVVHLRGEAKRPEQVNELERRAREIPEVRDVENLLHLAKTPAPTRADTPKRAQRSATTRKPKSSRPATRRRGADAVGPGGESPLTPPPAPQTARVEVAEPTGRELAAQGEGRQPAPLGSTDAESPAGEAAGRGSEAVTTGHEATERPQAPSAEAHTADSPKSADDPGFTTRVQEELKKEPAESTPDTE